MLHDELEPGSQLCGGALETAGIDSESLAERSGECKSFKSSAEGNGKRIGNLEARSGIEPPMRVLQTHALPLGYRAIRSYTQQLSPRNEKTHLPRLPAVGYDFCGLDVILRGSASPHQKTSERCKDSNNSARPSVRV